MRIARLLINVFAVILLAFAVISLHVSNTSSRSAGISAQPHTSHVLVADGGDPLPRPWKK
jgi:hypothetical protein